MLFFLLIGFALISYGFIKFPQEQSPQSFEQIIRQNTSIKKEILEEILKKVEFWESQHGFLDNSVNLQSLAKKLNTNSTYLSKTINVYKRQNFASYLREIRITYAINDLKQKPEILKTKSTIQIAEMYGFNSLSVFTKSFKSKTGITPGVFFKNLIEREFRNSIQ